MKSHVVLSGSSVGLAAVMHLDTTVGFLQDREETIALSPMLPVSNLGYVWRKVFNRRAS